MSVGGMTRRCFLALGALVLLACAQGCAQVAAGQTATNTMPPFATALRPGRSGFDVLHGVAVP